MSKSILSDFYGDNTRWFVATVVDATPPYGSEGRVKIRIHGLHTESTLHIPQKDLPWAQCILPTTEGGVSGIGRMAKLQPNSLVFGIFADGKNSQTPLIFGSISHIESPTNIQVGQSQKDIGVIDESPSSVWEDFSSLSIPNLDVEDDNTGTIKSDIKLNREKSAVQFFLNIGYTLKQSVALVAGLSISSGMVTGTVGNGNGLGGFDDTRYTHLKSFSNNHRKFSTQLSFIAYELRGKLNGANIKLLRTNNIEGVNGSSRVIAYDYLPNSRTKTYIQLDIEKYANKIMENIG